MEAASWIADGIALVAALFAGGAWWSSRRSARASVDSAKAAEISARATEKLAAIEQSRQHDDLRPELEMACHATVMDEAQLSIHFVGPQSLDGLEDVTVRIREEDGKPQPGPMHTEESLAKAYWGPYIFKAGITGVNENRTAFGPFALRKDETVTLGLAAPPFPSWNTNAQYWRSRFADAPLRLAITCRAEGYKPWNIVCAIPVQADPATQVY